MNRIRTAVFAVLLVCGISLGAAGTASAAQQPAETPLTRTVELTGTKGFTGTYTIDRFAVRNGKMVAVGTVKGTMRKNGKTRSVRRSGVRMPVSVVGAGQTAGTAQLPPPQGGNSCQILNLVIGPINLNLLGLIVRTNQIELRIDAQRGPNNLLGNLLCAITGILNPSGGLGQLTGAINQLVAALNAILQLIPQGGPATAAAAAAGR